MRRIHHYHNLMQQLLNRRGLGEFQGEQGQKLEAALIEELTTCWNMLSDTDQQAADQRWSGQAYD